MLEHEGGYTNHPSDPGGPTNFGITIHDYRRFIEANGTALDVKNMKRADAAKIYRARYWDALRCDELPAGLDYAVFDYGVNSGSRSRSESHAAAARAGAGRGDDRCRDRRHAQCEVHRRRSRALR